MPVINLKQCPHNYDNKLIAKAPNRNAKSHRREIVLTGVRLSLFAFSF